MNFVNIVPIPGHGSLNWPQTAVLSMLRQDEITAYDHQHSLYMHIQNHRGTQTWKKLDASVYVQLPNTLKYTSGMSLQRAASRCRTAMIGLICIHNERAGAHNRALQAQQQNDDGDDNDDAEENKEEEVVEKAEWTSIIVAVKAKLARDAYGGTLYISDSENTADAVSSASQSQHTIFQNLISLDILPSLELASVACSQQNLSPCQ
ncbi:hypothetical protein BPAE_0006g01340 [Botrytis paeoniae]|uniref:Uncharacterized protein n=1 Tax=Botrytis paeoniae TaxID=278948 RepID=A0A4Z1G8D8_9HELO|nr:hypothetical protein BPAE_0006g01340 [Botrytis paeoniae]